jgi:hypothetical protein
VEDKSGQRPAPAEPVAAHYEGGEAVHLSVFEKLEVEMLSLGLEEVGRMLDRADALVWTLTHLLLEPPPMPRAFIPSAAFPRGGCSAAATKRREISRLRRAATGVARLAR